MSNVKNIMILTLEGWQLKILYALHLSLMVYVIRIRQRERSYRLCQKATVSSLLRKKLLMS
nr:MAG TPA: hypothetical protein [Caudoviricetes sp.]